MNTTAEKPPMGPHNMLACMWGVYYILFCTVARYDAFNWFTLWVGCSVCVGITAFALARKPTRLPQEVAWFSVFFLWSVLGVSQATNIQNYVRQMTLVLESVVIVACLSYVVSRGKALIWLYPSLLIGALLNGVLGLGSGVILSLNPDESARMSGLGQPCSFGYIQILGLIGALGLWCERRLRWWRPLLAVGIILGLVFLVASGSRGPYLLVIIVLVVWAWTCLRPMIGIGFPGFVATIICLSLLGIGGKWVWENTAMGVRSQHYAEMREKGEDESRVQLAKEAFDVFLAHPVMGIGVGQFREFSSQYTEAHNEFGELLSTTGFVGFALMMTVYSGPWRRLSASARLVGKGTVFLRINNVRVFVVLIVCSMAVRSHVNQFDSAFVIGIACGMGDWASRVSKILSKSGLKSFTGNVVMADQLEIP